MSLKNYNRYIVLDLETTGLSFNEDEIIEIGAVLFEDGEKKDTFSTFVKPVKIVSDFIKNLTHITDEQLASAPSFSEAVPGLLEFLKDELVVCHNTWFDINFINSQLQREGFFKLTNRYIDTLEIADIYLPFTKNHKLVTLCEYLGIKLNNAHRAIYDAEATGKLFRELQKIAVDYIPMQVNFQIKQISDKKLFETEMDKFFEEVVNYQKSQVILTKENKYPFDVPVNMIVSKNKPEQETELKDIFSDEGPLSKSLTNYEMRAGQVDMSESVEKAFRYNQFLMVEAGTGVGKSLAYLIPALRFSNISGEKIILSTNTKNLQEQLFFKDLPLIKNHLQIPFKAALLKGRDNYICVRKWEDILFDINQNHSADDIDAVLRLVIWKHFTKTGDISENSSFRKDAMSKFWKRVAAERFFCRGRKCPQNKSCFMQRIRAAGEDGNLVIVNHSLMLADQMNENSSLGEYGHLIIDEAHNLPEAASNHLGLSIGYSDFSIYLSHLFHVRNNLQNGILPQLKGAAVKSLVTDMVKKTINQYVASAIVIIEETSIILGDLFTGIGKSVEIEGSYNKLRIKEFRKYSDIFANMENALKQCNALLGVLQRIRDQLASIDKSIFMDHDKHITGMDSALNRIKELIDALGKFSDEDHQEYAYWFSNFRAENYPNGIINIAPLDISAVLQKNLYDKLKALIFTSATISLRGKFKFMANRIGLNEEDYPVITKIVESPFNYEKQSSVLAASFLPQPSDKLFATQASHLIQDVIKASEAGTLVLFTSYKDLNSMYEYLSKNLNTEETPLLAQGKGLNRTTLLNEFKDHKKSILLGTSSFWEGVDIPGEALSLLIIYKLPFQVPTEPVIEAYIEKLEKEGKKSFMHYMLPNALLKYRQGFGRLVRNKKDTGIVLLLDNRVTTKFYGQFFKEITPTRIRECRSHTEIITSIKKFFHPLY